MVKGFLAIAIVVMLLFGCVNISDTAKASAFGKNAREQKALAYYTQKYGSPEGPGAPRILEPLVTTSVTDFMPADIVSKYGKNAAAFNVWFFYDNFGTSDTITVTFKYLDDGTVIHTFNSMGGGDYGAGSFTLQAPDGGWPTGNYEVEVSGKGVSAKVDFEVIDGATVSKPLPYDAASAPANPSPAPTQPSAPTGEQTTTDSVIFDTTPGYIGACSLTDTSTFTLGNAMSVSMLQIWYNWDSGETSVSYTLKKDGTDFASGTLYRSQCDPYQANWCNGNYLIGKEFPAGSYELKIPNKKMCLEPGKTGTVRLYGTVTTGAAAPAQPSVPLPAGVPTHLKTCDYSGNWNTDWGAMVLSQDGSKVTGTYTHDSGKLAGTLVDGVFVGKWSEYPSYSEPGDAGDAIFYFTGDCNSFTGSWQYGVHTTGDWSGGWVGTKSA